MPVIPQEDVNPSSRQYSSLNNCCPLSHRWVLSDRNGEHTGNRERAEYYIACHLYEREPREEEEVDFTFVDDGDADVQLVRRGYEALYGGEGADSA